MLVLHSDSSFAVRASRVALRAGVPRLLLAVVIMLAPPGSANAGQNAGTAEEWQALYQERLAWWSLQPLAAVAPPTIKDASWPKNGLDHFILAALEDAGLQPAAEADRRTLARRLSFALTGLPPSPDEVERFAASDSPTAYQDLVDTFLESPHFGERWARHWMDVVHYTDTHGYEWDTPAKNAWMYRDYLVRAFNEDVPYRQLILEQIAGDLIEARINPSTGINESLLGPMAMRLGERRHGDNADAEGVTQEAMANIIDTVSKGFLATTVACAQCHDHKLDAVAQSDYYGITGMLMSTRWIARSVDTVDPNRETIADLARIKEELRAELAVRWRGMAGQLTERLASAPTGTIEKADDGKKAAPDPAPSFPDSLPALWRRLIGDLAAGTPLADAWTTLAKDYHAEHTRRMAANAENLRKVADFTREALPNGWRVDGFGMKHGLVADGEIVVADEGDAVLLQLLPAGRWSHVWSQRLAGAVRSPLFEQDPPPTLSVGYAGGQFAAQSLVVDHAFHSERMKFLKQPAPGWLTFTAGNFAALAGGPDPTPRLTYLELVTKSLNNYFPPRTMFGGVTEKDEHDPRSWFGVTQVYEHAPGKAPEDELGRMAALFLDADPPETREDAAVRVASLVLAAVEHWRLRTCDSEDIALINEALAEGWLPNSSEGFPKVAELVTRYRETEARLQPDHVTGSVEDWNEGRDARIGIRGSYTELGGTVPRGNIHFLGGATPRSNEDSSGRLEFARNLARDDNPLTARVFANRVWHYLFGEGLVRTPDDFGHLGERPSHPELLDWLAQRFIEDGWSLKQLVRQLAGSATWRQSGITSPLALEVDAENRLWHHMPLRRLEAEAIRDSMLAVSGRLDGALYGPPIEPYRVAEDAAKRLYSGPLDGQGRRSLYIEMTLMEPPKFLALFNQPIPKLTTGRRDATNVPDQALALLNDPFVLAMAEHWADRALQDGNTSPSVRIGQMFAAAFARPPTHAETTRLLALAERCAGLHAVDPDALLSCKPVWQDVAHAIFNLKEFIYVQ